MARITKKRVLPCRVWDTFLRIPDLSTTDEAPIATDKWFEAKGVYSGAPAVLRLLQREVLPLVRRLEYEQVIEYDNCFFLVHDRESGVPTTKEDKGAYIHMRFYFHESKSKRQVEELLGDKWEMSRPIPDEGLKIAGIEEKYIRDGSVDAVREILKAQSALALRIVETYTDDVDLLALIGQVRQNLHYISNMFQIKVG